MFEKILVPLDGSKLAESVFPYLERLSKDCRSKEVILFRCCEPSNITADYPASMPHNWEEHVEQLNVSSAQQCSLYLKDAQAKLKDMGLDNIKLETRLGDPAKEIVDYASEENANLIIMASHGRTGPSRWAYGSVADKVFRSTCVPVLLIRGPECLPGV